MGVTMTSRTFATLFALTALAAVALPTSVQANCFASNGASVPTNGTQPCTPPSTGSGQKCNANGTWDNSACTVAVAPPPPPNTAPPGAPCGSRDQGAIKFCTDGTTCKPRRITAPRPWYCFFWAIGFNPLPTPTACQAHELETTDWFCDF
jgi:hypothetical protein